MKKFDELVDYLKDAEVLAKSCCPCKKEEKKPNIVLIVFAIIGAIAAVAGIAYAVYRYMTPDYLDDFDDDFDEFDDDFFEDEEDSESADE